MKRFTKFIKNTHYSYKNFIQSFMKYILKQYEIALNLHLHLAFVPSFYRILTLVHTASMCSSVDRRRITAIRLENVSGIER